MPAASTIIPTDIHTLWRWLTIPELMNQWMPGIENLRTVDGAPVKNGSILLFTARGHEHSTTVLNFAPNKCLTLQSVQGAFTADYVYRVKPAATGCEVSLDIRCSAMGVAGLFAPLIRVIMWLTDRGQLERLNETIGSEDKGY